MENHITQIQRCIMLTTTLLFGFSSFMCARIWRTKVPTRKHIPYIMVWVVSEFLFSLMMLTRDVIYKGAPPMSYTVIWLANVVWLTGAICISITIIRAWKHVQERVEFERVVYGKLEHKLKALNTREGRIPNG